MTVSYYKNRLVPVVGFSLIAFVLAVIVFFSCPFHRENRFIKGFYNENGEYICLKVSNKNYVRLDQQSGYRYDEDEFILDNKDRFIVYSRFCGLYLNKYSAYYNNNEPNKMFITVSYPRNIGSGLNENIFYDESFSLPELSMNTIDHMDINGEIIADKNRIKALLNEILSGDVESYALKAYGYILKKDQLLRISFRFKELDHLWFDIGEWYEDDEGLIRNEFLCDYKC